MDVVSAQGDLVASLFSDGPRQRGARSPEWGQGGAICRASAGHRAATDGGYSPAWLTSPARTSSTPSSSVRLVARSLSDPLPCTRSVTSTIAGGLGSLCADSNGSYPKVVGCFVIASSATAKPCVVVRARTWRRT